MRQTRIIGGRECWIYADDQPEALLIHALNVKERAVMDQQVELLRQQTDVPAVLAAFGVSDWKSELTPWPDPAVSRRAGDGDHAHETLEYVTAALLPWLREAYGPRPVVLGGYSLGGLFALWAASQSDCFDAVAAVSPTVWIAGWPEYAHSHPVHARAVFLSLGEQEERSRNSHIARVGENIRLEHALLQEQPDVTHCTLEWNPGDHFEDFARRNARAYAWCLNILSGKSTPAPQVLPPSPS